MLVAFIGGLLYKADGEEVTKRQFPTIDGNYVTSPQQQWLNAALCNRLELLTSSQPTGTEQLAAHSGKETLELD